MANAEVGDKGAILSLVARGGAEGSPRQRIGHPAHGRHHRHRALPSLGLVEDNGSGLPERVRAADRGAAKLHHQCGHLYPPLCPASRPRIGREMEKERVACGSTLPWFRWYPIILLGPDASVQATSAQSDRHKPAHSSDGSRHVVRWPVANHRLPPADKLGNLSTEWRKCQLRGKRLGVGRLKAPSDAAAI